MNPILRLPIDRVLALDPRAVETYLLSRGWEVDQDTSSREAGIYHCLADPEAEILLPRDRGLVDYALRLSEALQALAAVVRRTAWEVLDDLSARQQNASANGPAPATSRAKSRNRTTPEKK